MLHLFFRLLCLLLITTAPMVHSAPAPVTLSEDSLLENDALVESEADSNPTTPEGFEGHSDELDDDEELDDAELLVAEAPEEEVITESAAPVEEEPEVEQAKVAEPEPLEEEEPEDSTDILLEEELEEMEDEPVEQALEEEEPDAPLEQAAPVIAQEEDDDINQPSPKGYGRQVSNLTVAPPTENDEADPTTPTRSYEGHSEGQDLEDDEDEDEELLGDLADDDLGDAELLETVAPEDTDNEEDEDADLDTPDLASDPELADIEDPDLADPDLADPDLMDEEETTTSDSSTTDPDLMQADDLDDDDLLTDDDDLDFDDEESGSYDPNSGAQLTIAPFGLLTFAPSPEAVAADTLTEQGKTNLENAAERSYPLARSNRAVATVSRTKLHVTQNGNLSFSGIFSANGKRGKLKLQSFEDGEAIFSVTFPKKIPLQVTPDKHVEITDFTLSIVDGDAEFFAEESLFSKEDGETKIMFGVTGDSEATATAESLPLPQIIPDIKGNPTLSKIMLEELVFHMANPFAPQTGMQEMMIEAEAKLDHIKLWGNTYLSNSSCTITLNQYEIEFESMGDVPIEFDKGATLEKPEIEIRVQRGDKTEFLFGGMLNCNLPILGRMRLPVKGERRDDGVELRGLLKSNIKFGPLKIGQPQLVLYTTDGSAVDLDGDGKPDDNAKGEKQSTTKKIEVHGSAKLFGLEVLPIIRFVRPGGVGKRMVEFSGKFKSKHNLNPIAHIPGLKKIPGLGSLKLKNAFIGLDSTKSFFIGGLSKLFGVNGNAKILNGKQGRQVVLNSQKQWKLSDSIPSAKGSIFDSIVLDGINFNCSSFKGFDHEKNMAINKGINAFGALSTDQGVFKDLKKILGGALPKKVMASIVMNTNPRHCKYVISLPFDVKLSSKAMLHSLSFEISGEPSIALMLTLKFMPSSVDPPLLFTARIEFEIIGCALSGTMEGYWHHPFGIKGFHVGNLAVEVKLPYAVPPVPIAFGLAGTMEIGDFLVKVAVKLGLDDIILMGELSEFPLYQLPTVMMQSGFPLGKLGDFMKDFDIKLKDVKFKFAPTGGQIGVLYFEPGMSGEGKIEVNIPGIFKTYGEAGFNIDVNSGLKLYARMPDIDIGPLHITGKGQDRQYGTADDGPILYLAVSLTEQRLYLSSKATCLGNKAEVEADIKLTGAKMKLKMDAYATPLILMGIKQINLDAETYRDGWKVGIRGKGEVGFGGATMAMLGDLNLGGGAFAGIVKGITLSDMAKGFGIPGALLPDMGVDDLECYARAEPVTMIVNAAKPAARRAKEKVKAELKEMRDDMVKELTVSPETMAQVKKAAAEAQQVAAELDAAITPTATVAAPAA